MTLQQMRYAVTLAETGSFSRAAKTLYISQPSLSNSILSLEKELGTTLFFRSKKGIIITDDGHSFIERAKPIIDSAEHLTKQFYHDYNSIPRRFSLSSPRFAFVAKVFSLLSTYPPEIYDFIYRETNSGQVINDVITGESDIGIINITKQNHHYVDRQLIQNNLEFNCLYITQFRIMVNTNHPLSRKSSVSQEDLFPYPYLGYIVDGEGSGIMNDDNLMYSSFYHNKSIRVQDRATLNWLISNTNGYSLICGIVDESLLEHGISLIPFRDEKSEVQVGWIKKANSVPGFLTKRFIELLEQEIAERILSFPISNLYKKAF